MFVFSTQIRELLPLYLLSGSTLPSPPLSCVNKYTMYMHVQSV